MMAPANDNITDVERLRLRLEEDTAALRQSLKHWQTWEAEYEGLKEEMSGLKDSPTKQDLVGISRDFGGDIVNEGGIRVAAMAQFYTGLIDLEIRELVGIDKGLRRTPKQVIDLLSRRIEYVHRNVESLQKQLDTAEDRLSNVTIISRPETRAEGGLPLTDILEELDEHGNVIASTISHPGEQAPQVVEALRKAGVSEDMLKEAKEELIQERLVPSESNPETGSLQNKTSHATRLDAKNPRIAPTAGVQAAPSKKRVTFAEGTKEVKELDPSSNSTTRSHKHLQPHSRSAILAAQLEDAENRLAGNVPLDGDTPEEAALRREMLEYSLNEVGSVVAELDLEEDGSDFSDDEVGQDTDEYASSIEDEDEHGRTRRQVVSEDYRKSMLKLERRLDARMLENVGPNPEPATLADYASDTRRLVVRDIETHPAAATKPVKAVGRKGVRFADDRDIAPAAGIKTTHVEPRLDDGRTTSTPAVAEVVRERAPSKPVQHTLSESKKRKVSRFISSHTTGVDDQSEQVSTPPSALVPRKNMIGDVAERLKPSESGAIRATLPDPIRCADVSPQAALPERPRLVQEGPPNQIMSRSVIERDISPAGIAAPNNDDIDPAILHQEVATEYHRMRNKMIQRQGGFMPTAEEVDEPLYEEVNGKVRKVSRFKAAKLTGQLIP